MKKYACSNFLFILFFVALLGAPLIISVLSTDSRLSEAEKRLLAESPRYPRNSHELTVYPRLLEEYYNDHFGFREGFVQWFGYIRFRLGISPSDKVIIGKNGWLFYAGKDAGSVEDYRNIDLLTPGELETWRDTLETKHAWLKERGIAYIFVVAPEKHTIYPEYMPSRLCKAGTVSRLDQFVVSIRATTAIPVLDLRPALLGAKQYGKVYHQTDTHWNALGAYVAHREIVNCLRNVIPDIAGPCEGLDFVWKDGFSGDLAALMALHNTLTENKPVPARPRRRILRKASPEEGFPSDTRVAACSGAKKTLLMFMDSFGYGVADYLSDYFGQATYIKIAPDLTSLQEYVERVRPDVVIEETVERRLKGVFRATRHHELNNH